MENRITTAKANAIGKAMYGYAWAENQLDAAIEEASKRNLDLCQRIPDCRRDFAQNGYQVNRQQQGKHNRCK